MADKEFIVGLLEDVRRRLRSARRLRTVSSVLAIALLVAVVVKLVDLVSPLRGLYVAFLFAAWALGTAFYFVWLNRKSMARETIDEAAAHLDRSAKLQDQMRTAYWFICNPLPSEWVDVQIRNAAQNVAQLSIPSLYDRAMPRAFYRAVSLFLVFVFLNFVPQSLKHNWLFLQGAPPVRLSHKDQSLVERAKQLLEHTDAAKAFEKIVDDLQQGKITSENAQQQIADLRQQIDSGNLELNNILDGLTSIAGQLGQSPVLAAAAQAMSQGDLAGAADQIRSLAEKLGVTPADVLRELQKDMAQAAANSPAALKELSKPMQDAANALKNDDSEAGKIALENLAQALDQLAQKIAGQQQQSQAGRQLADLQTALQQEAASAEAAADAQAASNASSQGAAQGAGEGSAGGSDAAMNGTPSKGNSPGNGSGASSGSSASGSAEDLKPGQMTKLDVQLKMEGLKGQNGKGGELQDIEEASRQERSALDYRNVPSQLSPAQKDALHQVLLPREQREIVKYYFDEIRPQTTKAK